MSSNESVTVRMYRQGLGDCFLLTLPSAGEKPFRIMIDCGVIQGTPDATTQMRQVVQNIINDTDGFVDVLVVTHEHWDHVSGFSQARELFADPNDRTRDDRLAIGQVWLAWTEDETDPLARALAEDRRHGIKALQSLSEALNAPERESSFLARGLDELMGFFGARRSGGTTEAMDFAKSLGRQRPRYCRPSDDPWKNEQVPGIRIYTLGPPHDARMIKKTYSRKEVYHEFASAVPAASFFSAAAQHFDYASGNDREEASESMPFDLAWGHSIDRVRNGQGKKGSQTRLNAEELAFFNSGYWGGNDWRRIDEDWLGAAADFALKLDSMTNNTSLVLAVEMVDSGRVLLFAADAQVGNWLSWQEHGWTLENGTVVSGPDLLSRTVFYKVGHHGSHNATLKEKGLEQMNTQEFVAFLPVDVAAARKKNWNRMPLPGLVEALQERAKGRVVQLDAGVRPDKSVRRDFAARFTETPLYFEYRIGG